jgi:hypothetical protein
MVEDYKETKDHHEIIDPLKERLFWLLFADFPLICSGLFLSADAVKSYIHESIKGNLPDTIKSFLSAHSLTIGINLFLFAILIMAIHHLFEWLTSIKPTSRILRLRLWDPLKGLWKKCIKTIQLLKNLFSK